MAKRPWSCFSALSKEERIKVSRRAGIISQARGNGHLWTTEEAREAGRLGGKKRAAQRRAQASKD